MKFLVKITFLVVCLTFKEVKMTDWDRAVTSNYYVNTKLVTESENPFELQFFSKEGTWVGTSRITCSMMCARNATCLAFNFYSTDTHHVCELLPENFCSHRQRIALQIWPGGNVWDMLRPGIATRACIDQQNGLNQNLLPNNWYWYSWGSTSLSCKIARFGCGGSWPACNTCVKSCSDCYTTYGTAGLYNCTLWPQGPSMPPIFAFCEDRSTILVKRQVNLYNGTVWPDYNMSLPDMHRLSNLSVYTKLALNFKAFGGKNYTANYRNFYFNGNGSLMNMTWYGGSYDGFNIGAQKTLKPSPFLWVPANSTCGSFWWLNSTQGGLSTTDCPGGGVGLFGSVDVSSTDVKYKRTGIRWPQATKDNRTLVYTDMKMDI